MQERLRDAEAEVVVLRAKLRALASDRDAARHELAASREELLVLREALRWAPGAAPPPLPLCTVALRHAEYHGDSAVHSGQRYLAEERSGLQSHVISGMKMCSLRLCIHERCGELLCSNTIQNGRCRYSKWKGVVIGCLMDAWVRLERVQFLVSSPLVCLNVHKRSHRPFSGPLNHQRHLKAEE